MKKILVFSLLLLIIFSSCKKKNNPVAPSTTTKLPAAPRGTAWESSTINTNEIGGNNLTVVTAYSNANHVVNNQFKTIVSQKGTQVVFVMDKNNQLRGLSYTTKQDTNYSIQTVNAKSTVNSLFLLVPGMTTTSPTEIDSLFNNLSTLNTYNSFSNYVKQNLNSQSVKQILSDPKADTLFKETIIKYMNKFINVSRKQLYKKLPKGEKVDTAGNPNFFVELTSDKTIKLTNYGLRNVNVYRCYLENNNITNTTEIFDNMSGLKPASWGSFFTNTTYNPTIEIDNGYLPTSKISETDYWIIGPGLYSEYSKPPKNVSTNYHNATGKTIYKYCVAPMIDILVGTDNIKDEKFNEVWDAIKNLVSLNNVRTAKTKVEFESASIDFMVSTLGIIMTSSAAITALGISPAVAAVIGGIITSGSLAFSTVNLTIFTDNIMNLPPYAKKVIYTVPQKPKLLSPQNGDINQPVTIILKWNPVPIATSYMLQFSTDSMFNSVIFSGSVGNNTSKQLSGLSNSKLYYWRINAWNHLDEYSDWSDVWHFKTIDKGTSPSVPVLLSPSNDTTNISTTPTLTWSSSSGATSYILQVSTNYLFSNIVYSQSGITNTNQKINELNNSTKYYWRVKALNGNDNSDWSDVWRFTTSIYDGQNLILEDVSVVNANEAFIVGGYIKSDSTVTNNGIILKTTDGGNSWSSVSTVYLRGVCFTDANNGTVVGNAVMRTSDGGLSWNKQKTKYGGYAVSFINNNVGIMGGGLGIINQTNNGGVTWNSSQPVSWLGWIVDVCLVNAKIGYATGGYTGDTYLAKGFILKTTDGGINWQKQKDSDIPGKYGISFIDANHGLVVGNGDILKTIDGGNTWLHLSSGTTSGFSDVSFIDLNNAIAVGGSGIIIKTTDGGQSWIKLKSGTTSDLTAVSFINNNIGFVVGWNNTILKTTDGGNTWVKK